MPTASPEAPHLLHVFPTFGEGGREMRAVELMGMMPAGVRHSVIALNGCLDSMARVPEGVECRAIDTPRIGGGFWRRQRAMRECLRAQAPDAVLTYNWGSIEWVLAARRAGCAVVHHEDGFGPEEARRQLRRRVWGRRLALRGVFAVAVPSWRLFELARDTWRVPEDRLFYLPNGVDTERFHPVASEPEGEIVFVCVGRVRPEKNQAHAVEAFARAECRSRSRLRIVGDGSDLEGVKAFAEVLGVADRVDFTGAVRDTAPQYRSAHVLLIPSKTEQMPLALIEAMATALPAVSTDVGDVRRMVAEENQRWIVPADDVGALQRAMDEAVGDAAARSTIGAANRQKVLRNFERNACYGRYVDLYLRAAGERRQIQPGWN